VISFGSVSDPHVDSASLFHFFTTAEWGILGNLLPRLSHWPIFYKLGKMTDANKAINLRLDPD